MAQIQTCGYTYFASYTQTQMFICMWNANQYFILTLICIIWLLMRQILA